jgi:predicted RNA polymerase sigma factor
MKPPSQSFPRGGLADEGGRDTLDLAGARRARKVSRMGSTWQHPPGSGVPRPRARGQGDGALIRQASRLSARTGPDGAFLPITEQDRARWDRLLIRRGLDALARAESLGGDGPYVLQAALAACHARARRAADTDWPRIVALYDRLRAVMPSPVVDLNRAIACGMAYGPEAGLRLVDEIVDAAALRNYAPLSAARGDLLFRIGRLSEARSEFKAAATLTRNARERAFLLARADACDCKH